MKRFLLILAALCLLSLAACGEKDESPASAPAAPAAESAGEPAAPAPAPAAAPEEPAAADDVFTFDALEIPVPAAYAPLLSVESEPEAWNEHWTPLISFTHRASLEAYRRDNPAAGDDAEEGVGWIATVMRLDRVGFEDWLSGERSGTTLFARDDADRFYLLSRPTDVPVYEPDDAWTELNDWAATLPRTIIERNGLAAYDASELFAADYTYPGEHVDLGYRVPGQPMDLIVLSLSQPVKQGEGGIWCVERVRYVYSAYSFTDTQLVFPVSFGVDEPAADYYARLQAACDAGEQDELLTTVGAALDYAGRTKWLFGEDVNASDFELVETEG